MCNKNTKLAKNIVLFNYEAKHSYLFDKTATYTWMAPPRTGVPVNIMCKAPSSSFSGNQWCVQLLFPRHIYTVLRWLGGTRGKGFLPKVSRYVLWLSTEYLKRLG